MKRYKIFFTSLVLMMPYLTSSFSQEVESLSDFESWSSIGVEYKTSRWDFALEEQLRLRNNSSIIDEYFTQLEAGYELFNNFDLRAGMRFIRNNDTKGKIRGYENHLRLQFDLLVYL